MKTPFRYRVFLPVMMTGMQLALLAASLIIHREPWILPTPPESQGQNQPGCSSEGCVQFSPLPPEPKAGRIVEMAALLDFPAVFLGAVLNVIAGVLHIPTSEQSLLGFSAVLVPMIWYRIGKWLDQQLISQHLDRRPHSVMRSVWTSVSRLIVWFLFATMSLSLLLENRHHTAATNIMAAIVVLWTGAYLAGGLWGDYRRSARRRVAVE